MSNESSGFFFRQLPSALPGLALIVITIVIRIWIEPWMAVTKVFGMQKPLTDAFHLNYILLGHRQTWFNGNLPDWRFCDPDHHHGALAGQGVWPGSFHDRGDGKRVEHLRRIGGSRHLASS